MKLNLVLILLFSSLASAEIKGDVTQEGDLRAVLRQTLKSAVERDYQYKRLLKDLETAKSSLRQRKFEFLPTVNFSSSIDEGDSFTSNNLAVRLNLFNGFQDYYSLKASREDVETRRRIAEVRKRRVEFDAAAKIFAWVDLMLRLKVQEQELVLRKNSLEIMQKRFRRGMVPEDEVLKMRVDWLSSQVDLQGLLQRMEVEEKNFKEVFGFDIRRFQLQSLPEPNFSRYPSRNLNWKQKVLLGAPEVIEKERAVARERWEWKEKKATVYSPSLAGRFDLGNSSSSSTPYRYTGELGLTLSVPLFSQWEDQSAQDRAKFELQKAEFRLEEVKRDVLLNIEQKIGEMKNIQASYKLQKKAVEMAERFYQQSVERFRLGIGNSNDMALDLQRFTRAKTQLSRVKRDFFNAAIEIQRSSGENIADIF